MNGDNHNLSDTDDETTLGQLTRKSTSIHKSSMGELETRSHKNV